MTTRQSKWLKIGGEMKVFDKPNLSNDWKCPICRQATVEPVVLVPVAGTEEGNIVEAQQIHHKCALLVAKIAIATKGDSHE